jgi:UDP-3-O-[3-hydroxymyristoyl] glucosamine N-acyltransferase
MMRLSALFPASSIVRDAEVRFTHPPRTTRKKAACYALDDTAVQLANANPNIAAILTTPELANLVHTEKGCSISSAPKAAFYALHNALFRNGSMALHGVSNIHPTAKIAATVVIGKNVIIESGVTIGAHAVLEDFTIVGAETLIGPHAVIGGRGLQDTFVGGENTIIEFAGGVRIGRRCEILSAALIQRPYFADYTEIGDDVKLGPGASIGHGAHIGRATCVGARSVVAGTAKIGCDVWIGPASAISDGIEIGDRARVQLGSVVVRSVPDGEVVSGNFALPHSQHLRIHTRNRHDR